MLRIQCQSEPLTHEEFDHTIDRKSNKKGPITVKHLSLSVIGGLQPDRLSSLLFSGDDDGQATGDEEGSAGSCRDGPEGDHRLLPPLAPGTVMGIA